NRRPELAHDDAAGAEAIGVVGDGGHVVEAGGQPDAAVALGVGHGAGAPQLVPDGVRVGGPGVVGVVEVGLPVGDRFVTSHKLSSMVIACSGQLATATRAFC